MLIWVGAEPYNTALGGRYVNWDKGIRCHNRQHWCSSSSNSKQQSPTSFSVISQTVGAWPNRVSRSRVWTVWAAGSCRPKSGSSESWL